LAWHQNQNIKILPKNNFLVHTQWRKRSNEFIGSFRYSLSVEFLDLFGEKATCAKTWKPV